MTRILIVDDQDEIRAGIKAMLRLDPSLVVAGDLSDGLQVVPFLRDHPVDLVLMDIRMPGIDGIEATRRIAEDPDLAATRVVVLTTFEHDQYVVDGLRAGASGFLLKNTPPAELVAAIRTVHDGGALLAPSATRTLIREFTAASPRALEPHPRIGDLTEREREVVGLVAQGMSNHEIAEELVLSPATARTHVSRAMIKLAARDRAQLVVFAYQSGLA